jgi:hypothetical protein
LPCAVSRICGKVNARMAIPAWEKPQQDCGET